MKEYNIDQGANDDFSAAGQLTKYFRHKWLFLISFLVCIVLAFAYTIIKTPLYGIYASIVIKDEKKGEPSDFPFRDIDVFDDRNTVDNESEIIRSKTIVTAVTEKLGLNINYYYRPNLVTKVPFGYRSPVSIQITENTESLHKAPLKIKLTDTSSYELINARKKYRFGELVKLAGAEFVIRRTPYFGLNEHNVIEIAVDAVEETAQNLRSNLSVAQTSKNASMLNLALLHPVPEQGIDILNSVIQEYNKSNYRYREAQTAITVNIIQQRLDLLTGQLDTIENTEQNYKSRMGITELSADAQLFLDKAKESDNRITDAEIKMEVLKSIEQYALSASGSAIPPTAGLNDPVLLTLLTRLNELELEQSELAATVGTENTNVKIKSRQIADLRKSILDNIAMQKQNSQSTLNRLAQEKGRIDHEIKNVPLNERNLTRIVRQKNIHESIYNYLLQKREEANISAASEYSKLRIVDSSFSSIKPVKPDRLVTLLTGLLFAIALPIVVINSREALNKRMSDPSVLSLVNAPLLGEISWDNKAHKTPFMKNGHSFVSEQFRILISSLRAEQPAFKTLLITSSEPGEGKSYISTHLTEVLATWGNTVILVDADLRKGKMSKEINIETGMPGLSDYLADATKNIQDVIFRYKESANHLHLITSGKQATDVSKLLMGSRLNQLFDYLKQNYEYIIINTPPVRFVSDAFLLAKHADLTLYVVRNGVTQKNNLKYISRVNEKATLGKIYMVLNDSPENSRRFTRKYKEYFDLRH